MNLSDTSSLPSSVVSAINRTDEVRLQAVTVTKPVVAGECRVDVPVH